MPTKTVIARTRRADSQVGNDFQLKQEMMPVLAENGNIPLFAKEYGMRSWNVFQNLPLPTITDEAWRRTDIKALKAGDLRIPSNIDLAKFSGPPGEFLESLVGDQHGGQVIFGAGLPKIFLDRSLAEQGVVFEDLITAYKEHPLILEKIMGKIVKPEEGKFSSLASAFASNGVLLYVPKGVNVEQPLHSLLWGEGSDLAYLSHLMVYVDDGASLTYMHEICINYDC